jgi:hypothetical protein
LLIKTNVNEIRTRFEQQGFLEPFPLLSAVQCSRVLRDAQRSAPRASWVKGLHEFDSACTRVALSPTLIDSIRTLLGTDVILWSTQLIEQGQGARHRWHADFEAMAWPTVDVWVGLRDVGSNSFLRLIPGSHRWGTSPQAVARGGDLFDDEFVRNEASRFDPTAQIRELPMEVGEVLIFDGRLWHGSHTPGPERRSALLLQYSPATAEPRMLKFSKPDEQEWLEQRPGCLVVSGTGSTLAAGNRVITPQRLRCRPIRVLLRRRLRSIRVLLHRIRRSQ